MNIPPNIPRVPCTAAVCTSSCSDDTYFPVSFEGAPDDPLLRAEIAKRDKARGALNDEAAESEPTERPAERDSSAENVEAAVESATVPKEDGASREKALAKEVTTTIFLGLSHARNMNSYVHPVCVELCTEFRKKIDDVV